MNQHTRHISQAQNSVHVTRTKPAEPPVISANGQQIVSLANSATIPNEILSASRLDQLEVHHPNTSRAIVDSIESQQHSNLRRPSTASQLSVRQRFELATEPWRQLYHNSTSSLATGEPIGHHTPPPSYQSIPGVVPYFQGSVSGPPPAYSDVIDSNASPPTYQSLYGQLREARKNSRSFLDLLRRLLIILFTSLGFTIVVTLMLLVPLSMIIIGATYIDQCKAEHLPAFLLVGGIVWATKNIVHCYIQCDPTTSISSISASSASRRQAQVAQLTGPLNSSQQTRLQSNQSNNHSPTTSPNISWNLNEDPQQCSSVERRIKSSICESLLNCVLLGWFIAGCVIVFRSYEPDYINEASSRYCHRTVYLFSFWLISSICSIFGLILTSICILMVSASISKHQSFEDLV